MKPLYILAMGALLLAGCATQAPPPGTVVAADKFSQQVIPGRTTRAELLAAFGPTRSVAFDSGYQAWVYSANAGAGGSEELVLLLDRDGIVRKMRRRPAYPSDTARR
jgi:hypothetical protein